MIRAQQRFVSAIHRHQQWNVSRCISLPHLQIQVSGRKSLRDGMRFRSSRIVGGSRPLRFYRWDVSTPCFSYSFSSSTSYSSKSSPSRPTINIGNITNPTRITNSNTDPNSNPSTSPFDGFFSLVKFAGTVFIYYCMLDFVTEYFVTVYRVDGSSMSPLLLDGDWVLVARDYNVFRQDTSVQALSDLKNSVVVLVSPYTPEKLLVKRIKGVPGDKTEIMHSTLPFLGLIDYVPQGQIWVEGDNRKDSVEDSREYGPFPAGLLRGSVKAVVWPPSRISLVS